MLEQAKSHIPSIGRTTELPRKSDMVQINASHIPDCCHRNAFLCEENELGRIIIRVDPCKYHMIRSLEKINFIGKLHRIPNVFWSLPPIFLPNKLSMELIKMSMANDITYKTYFLLLTSNHSSIKIYKQGSKVRDSNIGQIHCNRSILSFYFVCVCNLYTSQLILFIAIEIVIAYVAVLAGAGAIFGKSYLNGV